LRQFVKAGTPQKPPHISQARVVADFEDRAIGLVQIAQSLLFSLSAHAHRAVWNE
jgi:hypothetical protein